MNENTLPAPIDAEKAYIGSLLRLGTEDEHAELAEVIPLVRPQDFADESMAIIKRAIDHLHRADQSIDSLTVVDRLRSAGLYEKIGGAATMADAGLNVPTAAHARYYAKIVRDAAETRWAYQILNDRALGILRGDLAAASAIDEIEAEIKSRRRDVDTTANLSIGMFDRWAAGIVERQKQPLFECGPYGSEINKFRFGPEQVVMIGAPPAAGKTAFIGQVVFDAIRYAGQDHLKLLIANCEMSPGALLTRQCCRTSGVSYSYLQHRDYDETARPRIEASIDELRGLMERVEFLRPPFTLENLRRRAEAFEADIVVVDYAQRFSSEGKTTDLRTQTNAVMDSCRLLADQGRAVLVVSAISRQKGTNGSTYDSKSLGLASFRESSELEYGADSAWLLLREPDSDQVELRQVKNRTGKLESVRLLFDGSHQEFRDDLQSTEWNP